MTFLLHYSALQCTVVYFSKVHSGAAHPGAVQCVPWLHRLSPGYRQVAQLLPGAGPIPPLQGQDSDRYMPGAGPHPRPTVPGQL